MPLVDTGHSDNHEGHDPAQIRAPDHHSLEESENHHQVHDAIVGDTPEPATLEPPTKPADIPHQPLQRLVCSKNTAIFDVIVIVDWYYGSKYNIHHLCNSNIMNRKTQNKQAEIGTRWLDLKGEYKS